MKETEGSKITARWFCHGSLEGWPSLRWRMLQGKADIFGMVSFMLDLMNWFFCGKPKPWSSGKRRCIWFYFIVLWWVKCPSPDSIITTQFIQELLRLIFSFFSPRCAPWREAFILQVVKLDIISGSITLAQIKWTDRPNGTSQENLLPLTSSWWEPFTFTSKWKCAPDLCQN